MNALFESARFLALPDQLLGGKQFWKYLVRGALLYPWTSRWANYVLADSQLRSMVARKPCLLFKLQRPYLRKRAGIAARLGWLRDHYDWTRRNWTGAFAESLYEQGAITLATLQGDQARAYQIVLTPTGSFDREGELVLSLETEGQRVAVVSFTVHRHEGEWVVDIGCLQGPRPELGRDAVKTATGDLHGLRPKQAILVALYAFASGYGLRRIQAVSNQGHIYMARWRRRSNISADYDGFWAEMGGMAEGDSFRLPTRMARKTLEEIPSRKRAQYRRRHLLEDTMIAQIRDALPGCAHLPVFEGSPAMLQAVPRRAVIEPAEAFHFPLAA
ncbi:MAG: DUF535 domain-containing protein [Burkholderiales bacterium]|nr:DUF535 domain-containing protein [Burkholderiales bacterium]